jgi:hypothetical integral membrane protein (TIGR02206 family)
VTASDRLLPILVIALVIVAVILVTRRLSSAAIGVVARVLALSVLIAEFCWWGYNFYIGNWAAEYNLPLHICEAGAFLLAGALWFRRQLLVEIAYFWGLGGTLPGLFTPVLPVRFPNFEYFQYYVEHGLIVLGSLFLVLVMRLRPVRGAVGRALMFTACYAAAVGVIDYYTGGNYLFLRQIPPVASIFNYLGPWPWYILSISLVAALVFWGLYMPFANDRLRTEEATAGTS